MHCRRSITSCNSLPLAVVTHTHPLWSLSPALAVQLASGPELHTLPGTTSRDSRISHPAYPCQAQNVKSLKQPRERMACTHHAESSGTTDAMRAAIRDLLNAHLKVRLMLYRDTNLRTPRTPTHCEINVIEKAVQMLGAGIPTSTPTPHAAHMLAR